MSGTPDTIKNQQCRDAIMRKVHESTTTAVKFFEQYGDQVEALAAHMAAAFQGGQLSRVADWNFVVPSYSIYRIQETHVILLHVLWDLVHIKLGEEDIV